MLKVWVRLYSGVFRGVDELKHALINELFVDQECLLSKPAQNI